MIDLFKKYPLSCIITFLQDFTIIIGDKEGNRWDPIKSRISYGKTLVQEEEGHCSKMIKMTQNSQKMRGTLAAAANMINGEVQSCFS